MLQKGEGTRDEHDMDIGHWLKSIGLEIYAETFEQNGIDAELLPELTNEDLKDLGIDRLADRKRLLKAIQARDDQSEAVISEPGPASILPEGEYRHVSVLFADLAGYTELTSRLGAEETHAVLNRYFDLTDTIVQTYGGTVDKHIGDNVMAVFGAPIAHDDDPLRAVSAAIDIHRQMDALAGETGLDLSAHIGIAAGKVVASGTGSDAHREYTVTGDAVNLAARLQDRARSGETFVCGAVRSSVADRAVFEDRGEIALKGIDQPTQVWRVVSLDESDAGERAGFVGRRSELAQITGIIAMLADGGSGQALVIRGEAGIGKTRLTEEVLRLCRDQGFACHRALVLDFGVGENLETVPSIVRSLLGLAPRDTAINQAAAIGKAVEDGLISASHSLHLSDILGLEMAIEQRVTYSAMDNATRAAEKRSAISTLLGRLSKVQPVAIVVEDIHWSTSEFILHLADIAAIAAENPVLLVMTSRVDGYPLDAAWSVAAGGCPISTIDLMPLRIEEAIRFAESFAGNSGSFAQDCIQRAAGNPLFLEQLLHNVREQGSEEVPASIQSLVMARLDRQDPADKAALQAASVLGQRFSLSAVRHLIGDPGYDCQELVKRQLIKPEGDGYLFAHALVQEGVYASLLTAKRAKLHRDAATWFAQSHPELRAEHLDRADDAGAPDAYLEAAQLQAADHHHDTALRLAGRGLELASTPETQCDLMSLRGDALRNIGDTEGSIVAFESALERAGDDVRRCCCLIGIAGGLRIADRQSEALDILQGAEEAAIRAELTAERARICYLRGNAFFPLGDNDGCLREHQKALQFARAAGSAESEALSLGGLGDAYYLRGHMRTACEQFRACVDISRQHGFGRIEVANSHMIGWTRMHLMEFIEASKDASRSIEMAREVNHRRAECLGCMLVGQVGFIRNRLEEAQAHIARGMELAQTVGANNFQAQMLTWLARISMERGDLAKARTLADDAVTLVEKRTGLTFIGPTVYAVRASLLGDADARGEAMGEAERILDSGSVWHNQVWFSEVAIETALADSRWEEADRLANRLEGQTREERLEWPDFLIARSRALAAWRRGERGPDQVSVLNSLSVLADEKGHSRMAQGLRQVISGA